MNPSTVALVQNALGLHIKKGQRIMGCPGFSLHFREVTYIIYIRNQKGTSYIFDSIMRIYRTHTFIKVHLPTGFTNADIFIYKE